jgi:hypothetical protein
VNGIAPSMKNRPAARTILAAQPNPDRVQVAEPLPSDRQHIGVADEVPRRSGHPPKGSRYALLLARLTMEAIYARLVQLG